jgi:hypothetical protein
MTCISGFGLIGLREKGPFPMAIMNLISILRSSRVKKKVKRK